MKARRENLFRCFPQCLYLFRSGNMLGSDSFALPLLNLHDPVFFSQKELQSGLVRNEVRNGNGNAPAGIHAKCHPAGAYIFPDCNATGVRIVKDFLHYRCHQHLESRHSCPARISG